jgi:YesN/AraC family two-component response regulator
MAGGEVADPELREMLARYPQGNAQKIQALAELLLICAESLSTGSGEYQGTLWRRTEQQIDITSRIEELKKKFPLGSFPTEYPLEKEQLLLETLRRGNAETGKKILNELLAVLFLSSADNFKNIQFRAIELEVLLSRTVISPGYNAQALLETNDHFLKSIQESKDTEELTDILHMVVDLFAGRNSSFQGIRHASALKKAEWFIWDNYTRKISLKEIAGASGLSAPYFSTIFKEEMGENLSSYLNRLRVGKASQMLMRTDHSLSKIAGACGFEDQSWFSKIFKSFTSMSPGKFRAQGGSLTPANSGINFSDTYRDLIES